MIKKRLFSGRTVGLILLALFGLIYSLPNLYGEDPVVQIAAKNGAIITEKTQARIKKVFADKQMTYRKINTTDHALSVRFTDVATQLQAKDMLTTALGNQYTVALNLAPRMPAWLAAVGAAPLKLGLDLRGGIHFLLHVNVDAIVNARETGELRTLSRALQQADIRYTSLKQPEAHVIALTFLSEAETDNALLLLGQQFPQYHFKKTLKQQRVSGASSAKAITPRFLLTARIPDSLLSETYTYVMNQTMTTLRQRVNELGVSEAIVQQQGHSHISVDLPGIQDIARAKELIGKTATLRFQLVNISHDISEALAGHFIPGAVLHYDRQGRPILVDDDAVLEGSAITYASALFREGQPAVNIHLGGGGENHFHQITANNIGRPLAVVYTESRAEKQMIDGQEKTVFTPHSEVISVAMIQSALGNNFDITGLNTMQYAENLALLLRSGALAAPVEIVQETTIGPSLGQGNIRKGLLSMGIGSLLVILFMAIYYRLLGVIANLALVLNVLLILAILSLLGATLTLPGIAGIVLTVGMAVDANVLINERIREEKRLGMKSMASVRAGYERAMSTIVDANVTTLIVALILCGLGSGSVKGFAITLIIGLLCSMVTSIVFTRAIIEFIYKKWPSFPLSIGI